MLLETLTCTLLALAPPLGGEMNHVSVELDPAGEMVLGIERPGFMFLSEPASGYVGVESVLNGTGFNGQYGWLAAGFWSPPFGTTVWIEMVEQDPRLSTYLGRPMGSEAYFEPIFGTDGSSPRLAWDGSMLHNYYASSVPGVFEADYRVYVGDATGVPLAGYTPGSIHLQWMSPAFDPVSTGRFSLSLGAGGLVARGYLAGGDDDGGGTVRPYANAVHAHWTNGSFDAASFEPGFDLTEEGALAGHALTLELIGGTKWVDPPAVPDAGSVPTLEPLGAGESVHVAFDGQTVSTDAPGSITLTLSALSGEAFNLEYTSDDRPEGYIVALEFVLRSDAPGSGPGTTVYAVLAPDGDDPVEKLHHASLYLESYLGLTLCPADLNGDGVLDNGDIGTFVALFLAGDLASDLNADGVLDNGDIGEFVSQFLAGC